MKYWDQRRSTLNARQYRTNYRKSDHWNGYTDPDDFPTDGLGDNGY
ncbi:MAG: hypothetical protein IJK46_09790 [Prevotella sp.]|nr:hypothetical protein [Prevotella sp.]